MERVIGTKVEKKKDEEKLDGTSGSWLKDTGGTKKQRRGQKRDWEVMEVGLIRATRDFRVPTSATCRMQVVVRPLRSTRDVDPY